MNLRLLLLAAGALILRIPAFFSRDHLGFDDGVYGVSALALRAGEVPYRDIFCPQGPLFFPLLWLADLAGLRVQNAPRLLPLAAGVAVTAATWVAGRHLRLPRPGPEVAAALVATSGVVLWVTGPITGDGPALALATTAVAALLWWRQAPSVPRAVAVGVAIGAALSVKSLVIPAAVPIGWALLSHRPRTHLAVATAAATAVGLGFAALWGIADVWDQSVRYHLDGGTEATPIDNIRKLASTLADRDLVLLVGGAAVGLGALDRRRRGAVPETVAAPGAPARRPRPVPSDADARRYGLRLVALWLAVGLLALVVKDPLYRNHMSSLAPPAALLVGAGAAGLIARWRAAPAAPRVLALGLLAFAAAYHAVHLRPIAWPPDPSRVEAAARADIRSLPAGAWGISDEPGYLWREGRRTPSYLVDASVTRVIQKRITAPIIAAAAAEPQVCAVLVWSHRYGRFPDLASLLADHGYEVRSRYGGVKVLYVKDPCRP